MNTEDWKQARLQAFRSPLGGRVFSSIAQTRDVWLNDPFDEETIHADARQVFADQLEIASDRERGEPSGRILLLTGDAGAGKTHLMGAFRHMVEETEAGFFAYAQMSTELPSLRQYLLRNIVESLQKSGPLARQDSPWLRLSDALVERPCIPAAEREALRNEENYAEALEVIRARLLDDLKPAPGEKEPLHADFLTALLVLQRRDGNAQSAALRYFRGDPLSETDRDWLCSPHGLAGAGEPEQLLDWLLQAVREFGGARGGAFVLCLDQIEDLWERTALQQQRFPDIVTIVRALSDRHSGLIVVLACLDDYYTSMSATLKPPEKDRLELDPKPVRLAAGRTLEEITALVRRRLVVLDAEAGVSAPARSDDALYPFDAADFTQLSGLRPRAVLSVCHDAWNDSRRTGELPRIRILREPPVIVDPPSPVPDAWPQRWNDFRTAWNEAVPKADKDRAEILAWSINAIAQQTAVPVRANAAADLVHLFIKTTPYVAAICNGAAQGGKLAGQIDSLERTAANSGRSPVAVRETEFYKSPKAKIAERVKKFVVAKGQCAIFPDADWRAIQAWRAFSERSVGDSGFAAWAAAERPLTEIQGLRKLIRFDDLEPEAEVEPGPSPIDNGESGGPNGGDGVTSPAEPDTESDKTPPGGIPILDPEKIALGATAGVRTGPVTFDCSWFTKHLAVLGGTGSGKTTTAMVLLEGLLLRGIPVILVDRKGDLARYADDAALTAISGPEGRLFRERVEVALFTPGAEQGRPVALSVLPAAKPGASSQEIRTAAGDAAAALSAMLGYTESRTHTARRAALVAAIGVLLELGEPTPTLEHLLDLMNAEDPALLEALGYIDRRVLPTLVQDLESFRKLNAPVLGLGAEPLEAERLFGLGAHARAGKTRLCIISTKFLGADEVVQFWVAQLMMELARFASAKPSRELQAAIMLDEADLYLPAVGRPASKPPVENALRRFRSGGLGLVLATQSPGDFDYRCRENIGTWLVGRVGQRPALEKLRAVFGDAGASHLEKLAQHTTGEFSLVRPDALTRFKAIRNLLPTEQMSDGEILRAAQERGG